jgi:hypothetical protein
LLLVGANDQPVVDLNRQALRSLRCHKQLILVPGATHLFEEPGALEVVAHLAGKWFTHYLHEKTRHEQISREFGDRFPSSDMDQQC